MKRILYPTLAVILLTGLAGCFGQQEAAQPPSPVASEAPKKVAKTTAETVKTEKTDKEKTKDTKTKTKNTYPQAVVTAYTGECVKTVRKVTKKEITKDQSQAICKCSITKIQDEFTLADFTKLAKAKPEDQNAKRLQKINEDCVKSVIKS